jgi:hypothetical protein
MAIAVPIPVELWQRLAALDHIYDCFMQRRTEWEIPAAGGQVAWTSIQPQHGGRRRRAWHVRLTPRQSHGTSDLIWACEPVLADALLKTITIAESRAGGWLRSGTPVVATEPK